MMQTQLQQWLKQIKEQSFACQLNHIDLLINTTDMQCTYFAEELINLKPLPLVSWLFEGTPEEQMAHNGPALVRLDWTNKTHQHWLETLVGLVYDDFRVSLIISPWSFSDLSTVLRHYSQVSWLEGMYSGLFRYYEPRILPIAYAVLNEQQQRELQQSIIQWHYLDRDNKPQYLLGLYHAKQTITPLTPFILSDEQVDALFIWQAAESYRTYYMVQPEDYGLTSEQTLFNQIIKAQQHAYRHNKQQLSERDEFVKDWLDNYTQTRTIGMRGNRL